MLQSHLEVYIWVIVCDIRIEGEIVAWKPRHDIHILTLHEVDDGAEYIHIRRPKRNVWGEWAEADITAKLNAKDTALFSHFPHLNHPEMYIKSRSCTFPGPYPPYNDVQLCNVVLPVMNERGLQFVVTIYDSEKYSYGMLGDDTKLLSFLVKS